MEVMNRIRMAFAKLSMIGRALMLPISLLPAAGLLLAFGAKFDMPLMMRAGGVIFDNLPLLFAIGSAVGLAAESGIAALSAAVSMLIINTTISTLLGITP
ncbi:TPA: PTS transporter subunit EIIC, partial [Aeromonas hydrophila]